MSTNSDDDGQAGRRPHPRRPRGYLLIDVMIGGALVAVTLATIMNVVVLARNKNVYATRDIVATQLVLERLDQRRSLQFGSLANGTTTEAVVAGVDGKYKRVTEITSGSTSGGGLTLAFKEIKVTVTYTTNEALSPTTRSSQATTRVYQ